MKKVMAVCGVAAMTIGYLAPEQTKAGESPSAGPLGALTAAGAVSSAAAAVPRVNYGETLDTPACHWTRGRPVWDPTNGIWVRPRVQICD